MKLLNEILYNDTKHTITLLAIATILVILNVGMTMYMLVNDINTMLEAKATEQVVANSHHQDFAIQVSK